MQSVFRVGIGHDTHRFTEGTHLRLGGVSIPHERTLLGHSDADVLLHAITDAILGAAGLGDIGELFPDNDPQNKGKDSGEMLRYAFDLVRTNGWKIVNLDCIIFLERPKLLSYKNEIKSRIAELLETQTDRIGLKAKTGEKIGPIGREEAAEAQCVVLLKRRSDLS